MLCPFCQRPVERFLPSSDGGAGLRCPLCNEDGVPALYPGDYDRHPAVPVCIFGPTGHGKTVFIEALLTQLERHVAWPDFSPQWMDQAGMRQTRQRLQLLREHGQLPDATAAVFPRPQVIRLRGIPRVGGCQLLFYDTSGETFGDIELLRDRGKYVCNSPAVLWLVSLSELEYPEQLTDLMTIYAEAMAEMGGDPKSQCVIVALTKGDLLIDRPDLPAEASSFLLNDTLDPAAFDPKADAWKRLEKVSDAIEAWMKTTVHRRIVNLLREQFRMVRFCILSSQGASAKDQVLQMELMPRGVLAPLFWLWRETLPVAWVELGNNQRHPFFSLKEAVERAPAGATIRLGPFAYALTHRLEIRKPITVIGAGPAATLIRCAAEGFVIGVGVANGEVKLTGLWIAHTGNEAADAVLVKKGVLTMTECAVQGGVEKTGKSPGDGVRVAENASATLANCVAEQNQGSGVSCRDQALVVLRECKLRANGWDGVHAAGRAAEVLLCELSDNRRSGAHLTGSVHASVSDSLCTKNSRNGIGSFLDAIVDLLRNTCETNGLDGIVAKDASAVVIRENSCSQNLQAGISIHDTVTGIVETNTCTENSLSGIEVEDGAAPMLKANRSTRNRVSGINYADRAGGKCIDNICEKNGGHGIAIAGRAVPEIDANCSTDNKGVGFWIAEGAAPAFGKENTAGGNTKGEFHPIKWGRRGWFG